MAFWEEAAWWPVKLVRSKAGVVTMKFADGEVTQAFGATPLVPLRPWQPEAEKNVEIWKKK
jgi:hypothetical protein